MTPAPTDPRPPFDADLLSRASRFNFETCVVRRVRLFGREENARWIVGNSFHGKDAFCGTLAECVAEARRRDAAGRDSAGGTR